MSGASTGTYNIDADIKGMTEMQSGSYVFMDVEYRRIGGQSGAVYEDFSPLSACFPPSSIGRGRKPSSMPESRHWLPTALLAPKFSE